MYISNLATYLRVELATTVEITKWCTLLYIAMYFVIFQSQTGDNVEFTWQASVGKHKGYIPLHFLKENCYSNETLKTNGKSDRMTVAKMVSHVLYYSLL